MSNEPRNYQASGEKAKRQNSTSDYPMMGLRETCELVQKIREKGVESEVMTVVAKECGYSAPTSTGFYRRFASARLFKLVEPQGAKLTTLALDYIRRTQRPRR